MSHQTVKNWNVLLGAMFADEIKKRRKKLTRRWRIDEAHCKIAGKKHYLWRAVDSDGIALDVFVSEKRNKKAAEEFFSKLFCQYETPSSITTDRLRLYRSVVPETFQKTKQIKGLSINCSNATFVAFMLFTDKTAGSLLCVCPLKEFLPIKASVCVIAD